MRSKTNGKALLIGIDHYRHFPEVSLAGARQDARRLAAQLVEGHGFERGDIELLADTKATRKGIRQALQRLIARSRRDDSVVFFFAGHGTRRWLPDRHRADDYLSCIVPSDSAHRGTAPNLDITGEELSAWLRRLKALTANIVLIFDCCHSGAMVRDAGSLARWVEPDFRVAQEYPRDWPWSIEELDGVQRASGSWLPRSRTHTVLAACRSSERALELNAAEAPRPCGAFTHHLVEQLKKSKEETTYRDLVEAVRLMFRDQGPRQTPQVEGAADRLLFGLGELAPMRYVPVLGRDDQHVVLGGGAVHRTTKRSSWQIYPPATKSPAASPCLGTVEVTGLTSIHSEAKVVREPSPGAIGPGCRAVLSQPGEDWLPMTVHLDRSALGPDFETAFSVAIESSPWLSLAPTPSDYEVRATLVALDDDEEPSLALLDPKDRPCAPYRATHAPMAVRSAVENLEKRARYRRTLGLRSSEESLLEGKIRMVVHRKNSAEGWIPAVPRIPGEKPHFTSGEDFMLELTNLHDEPVFLYVLDFGIGGAIDLIYPDIDDLWQPVLPGHRVRTGHRMGEELTFYIPDTYPFDRPGASTSGIETLKLIATLEATDFRTVFQDSLRNGWAGQDLSHSGDFGELLGRLFLAAEYREVRRQRNRQDLPWTTLEIPLLLIRKAHDGRDAPKA